MRHSMASLLVTAVAVALAPVPVRAVPATAEATRDRVTEALSRRLFPLFDALGRDPAMIDRLKGAPGLSTLLRARQDRRAACGQDLVCTAQALLWTPDEIETMGRAATALPDLATADDGVAAQMLREMEGVNAILRTYALGQAPPYPQIDGAGAIPPQERQARLQAADWLSRTPRDRSAQGLDSSIDYALALLDVSDRTDAIGFEPLMEGANAPAMARARTVDWSRYRFSAMILTGVGPEIEGMPLSPYGKYHLRLAAARLARSDIPFIIVTGGRAHPRATRFAEAEEMRRALIDRYGVPADAIVMEPYARHTTTNLRNAARLLIAMGAPLDRDALIVCNPQQSAMIESARFVKRNADELGYQPGRVGRRFSPTELAFRPSRTAARIDPRDPLDP